MKRNWITEDLVDSRPINWELIRQHYDQMVKYATALRLGTAETEAILRRCWVRALLLQSQAQMETGTT